jgi:Cu+-exporting ATPase
MLVTAQPTDIEVLCIHCSEPCSEKITNEKGEPFCCTGCRAVYDLLQSVDGECSILDVEAIRGIKTQRFIANYLWLDEPTLASDFVRFSSATENIVRFSLPTIHCSACIMLLEAMPRLLKGVVDSRVNFLEKYIVIHYNPQELKLSELAGWLNSVGYPPSLTLATEKEPTTPRGTVARIAVAGFIFGNSMLFSLAEYFGIQAIEGSLRDFFVVLNVLFALPMVGYCASPYFKSAWASIKTKQASLDLPIALGISALFIRSIIDVVWFNGSGYFDSLSGLVFFLLIGRYIQQRSYEHLQFDRSVKSYLPIAVEVTNAKGDHLQFKKAKDLAKGEIINLANGQVIPADAVLISNHVQIDYSFVTGESEPQQFTTGANLFAGGRVVQGSAILQVIKPMDQSYFLELWSKANTRIQKDFALIKLNGLFAKYFTAFTLTIAALTTIYWAVVNPSIIWNATTAVLIVACPCALTLSLPFALGNAMAILGRKGIYLRNQGVLHQLAEIKAIVFDKTGTLVQMSNKGVIYKGKSLTENEQIALANLCNESVHPVATAIAHWIGDARKTKVFDFIEVTSQGIGGTINENKIRLGKAGWVDSKYLEKLNSNLTTLAIEGEVVGTFEFESKITTVVQNMVVHLSKQFPLYLLSGDKKEGLTDVAPILSAFKEVKTGLMPQDKKEFITHLEQHGTPTIMVGDGINDAAAMQAATVGLAVTSEKNSFTPASDIIMNGSDLSLLSQLHSFSLACRRNILNSFWLSVVYNLVGLSVAISGTLSPVFAAIFMPISSLSVVVFSTYTTWLSAKKRGFYN